ncbi:hypothetical protein [Lactococcus lactis]|uniref:hypothetical protein n=1 Tax=Lactococcus lactis TaxID=1358 RepID=UPI0022E924FA|nr:hypothetical protein [Lactococcus lactis]
MLLLIIIFFIFWGEIIGELPYQGAAFTLSNEPVESVNIPVLAANDQFTVPHLPDSSLSDDEVILLSEILSVAANKIVSCELAIRILVKAINLNSLVFKIFISFLQF